MHCLVTGGSGYLGSSLIKFILPKVSSVTNFDIIKPKNFQNEFEFIEGDITDIDTCKRAMEGVDYISHQAALGSVPRSIENPVATHLANATGFLNVLTAAKESDVKRIVFASSSSVYGDSKELPKREENIGRQLSPYAVSKHTKELYAKVFADVYGLDVIGLRYFNIFGPNQNPSGPYAAAIPLFMDAVLKNESPFINGDGGQSRDFTFVENAVQANIKALFSDKEVEGKIVNIACGGRITINELFKSIRDASGNDVEAIYREERPGDVRDSWADISLASKLIGYNPEFGIDDGIALTLDWFKKEFVN